MNDAGEKIALVTGGLSGIGAAVAGRMARDGHVVVAADIAAASTEFGAGPGIHPFRVDVSRQDSVASLVGAVLRNYGRIDYLVHCAGIGRIAPFLETSAGLFDLVLKTNLYGSFHVGQACAKATECSPERMIFPGLTAVREGGLMGGGGGIRWRGVGRHRGFPAGRREWC